MQVANEITAPEISRWQRWAQFIGLAGLVVGMDGWLLDPAQFYRAYLIAHVFWIGITLGCLALLLLHHLAGGMWGAVLLRVLEAGASTLALFAPLVLPLLFGIAVLYPWADPARVAADPLLQAKAAYLNVPFFIARAAGYMLVWGGLTWFALRWSQQLETRPDLFLHDRLRRLSALGLVALGLTATFAAVDWLMSLEPHWYSTIYAAMVAMGEVLAAFALVIALVAAVAHRPPFARLITAGLFNDFGSLLLAFVMLWMYLAFSQFLIIWSGNLSEEAPWYVRRGAGGWQWVATAVVVFNFAVPFLLLLARDLKRNARWVMGVAALVFVMRWVDTYWLVAPAFSERFFIHWLDIALLLGLGGLWLAAFLYRLKRHPLVTRAAESAAERAQLHVEGEHARA